MDGNELKLTRELLGLTFTRVVEDLARRAFTADRSAEFLDVVWQVCADCGVEPLSRDLLDRLAEAFGDPFDRLLLRVTVDASALWEAGGWVELIGALRRAFDPDCPARTPPARATRHRVRAPAIRRGGYRRGS